MALKRWPRSEPYFTENSIYDVKTGHALAYINELSRMYLCLQRAFYCTSQYTPWASYARPLAFARERDITVLGYRMFSIQWGYKQNVHLMLDIANGTTKYYKPCAWPEHGSCLIRNIAVCPVYGTWTGNIYRHPSCKLKISFWPGRWPEILLPHGSRGFSICQKGGGGLKNGGN